jgi:hypothetical protein
LKSGQAITKMGGPGDPPPPPPPPGKICINAACWRILVRANQQDLKTDFVFLNDTFGSLVGKKTQHLDMIDAWLYMYTLERDIV